MTLVYLMLTFLCYCALPAWQQHWLVLHVQSFPPFMSVFAGPGVTQPDNAIILPGQIAGVGSYGGLVATLVYFGFLATVFELLNRAVTALIRPVCNAAYNGLGRKLNRKIGELGQKMLDKEDAKKETVIVTANNKKTPPASN